MMARRPQAQMPGPGEWTAYPLAMYASQHGLSVEETEEHLRAINVMSATTGRTAPFQFRDETDGTRYVLVNDQFAYIMQQAAEMLEDGELPDELKPAPAKKRKPQGRPLFGPQ